MITDIGIIWILLGCSSIFVRRALIPIIVFSATFQTTAVLNFSIFGKEIPLIPYYMMLLLLLLRSAYDLSALKITRTASLEARSLSLMAFLLLSYTVVSTLILPFLFSGLKVYTPVLGIDAQYDNMSSLVFSLSNVGQLTYLGLNVGLLMWVLNFAREPVSELGIQRILLWCGFGVVLFAFWQLLSRLDVLWFPSGFLYNVSRWSVLSDQDVNGIPRMIGTFLEPSMLASYMVGYVAFCLRLIVFRKDAHLLPFLFLGCLVIFFSTSTAAYIGIGGVLLAFFSFFVLKPILSGVTLDGDTLRLYAVVMAGVFLCLLLFSAYGHILHESGHSVSGTAKVVNNALVNKPSTDSFLHRMAADKRAMGVLFDTYGLGAGLGSNRPSGFIAMLLSNLGIIGTGLFFSFLVYLTKMSLNVSKVGKGPYSYGFVAAISWGLWAHIFVKVLASPDMSSAVMWVWVFLLSVVVAQTHTENKKETCEQYNC